MKNLFLHRGAAVFSSALLFAILLTGMPARGADRMVYEPKPGPGMGKHIVFLTGDEEYRSEEGLPMLAKILSQRHGFKCTVLFAQDPDGTIDPNVLTNLPGAEALDTADCIVMLLRYRDWTDEQMRHFVGALDRGVPIIGLRTATHAFNPTARSGFQEYKNFGKRVLGENWVNHWSQHKVQATRGIIEPSAKDDPTLRGVEDLFVLTDVYEAYPPADATILVRGQALKSMKPDAPPAEDMKRRASDHGQQGVNDPMMPIAWRRVFKNEKGGRNNVFCTTMGAAVDLQNEGLRRLIVNAVYWGLGLDVPTRADVAYVDDYHPSMYDFKGYRKGIRPEDHALGLVLKPGTPAK